MKTILTLVTTAAVACLFCTTTEAAKPAKRTLAPLEVNVLLNADAPDATEYLVDVTGDCASANANIEYNVPVSVTYTVVADADLETTETVTLAGLAELETTIELTSDEDGTGTVGSTSFLIQDIEDAVQAAIEALLADVPEGATVVSIETGCEFVSAKAWTESNSVADSKPTEVLVKNCEE